MVASALILSETITPLACVGTVLILAGLILSQKGTAPASEKEEPACQQT
jgi:drug/metabolite transporter (DMT)-like permease